MQVLTNIQSSERIHTILAQAGELSEQWVGTLVADVIEDKANALREKPDDVALFSSLLQTIEETQKLGE